MHARHVFVFPALAVPLMLGVIGCQDNSSMKQVRMSIGDKSYTLEVAVTEAQHERGLMERDSMPEDHGMIFVFDRENVWNFYMKNTRFSLDILFLDHDGRIVSIRQMQKYDLTYTSSIFPAQYAIELNQGQAQASGIKIGQTLSIPAEARYGK